MNSAGTFFLERLSWLFFIALKIRGYQDKFQRYPPTPYFGLGQGMIHDPIKIYFDYSTLTTCTMIENSKAKVEVRGVFKTPCINFFQSKMSPSRRCGRNEDACVTEVCKSVV